MKRTSWGQRFAVAMATSVLAMTGLSALAPAAEAVQNPPVDVNSLDLVPLSVDGVVGQDPASTQTPTIENLVWDIQQAGKRIFVGGAFLTVQKGKNATPVPQPYLAAFDMDTGEWVDSCRPTFDRMVYALDRNPDGKLLVGGEFETVNGTSRKGLVALDPQTCQIDTTFQGAVDRPWSDNRAMVRDITLVGPDIYIAGNFSHMTGPNGQRVHAAKAGRMNALNGTADRRFAPLVTGSSVWGLTVDPQRNRVHFSGFFSGVNGTANSGYFHTVDGTTGASITGLKALPRNYPRSQPEMYDVAMGNNRVFVSGEQHVMEVLDPDTHALVSYSNTGTDFCAGDTFTFCGGFAGGAFQMAERIGDIVFAGCHCTYAERFGILSHYNSNIGKRTPNKLAMAYEASTGKLIEEFRPDLDGSKDGTWAAASDTNGCLYLGGDYQVGGVAAGKSRWVGGFGKFCPRGWTPPTRDVTAPSAPTGLEAAMTNTTTVQLRWNAATDDVAVTGYRVMRDGVAIADLTDTAYTDKELKVGATYIYSVLALDGAGNVSSPSDKVKISLQQAPGDTESPTVPTNVAVARSGSDAKLTWTASTDNVGVVSYLIYRDGAYIGWTPTPGYTDPNPGNGPFEYTVRATDAIGNRSLKSTPVIYTSAAPDVTPPTVPSGVQASAVGGGKVNLTWTASTDASGVASYLIYRDGAYAGWSATPAYTDTTTVGTSPSYQLRAVDTVGNRSAKSTAVRVTVK